MESSADSKLTVRVTDCLVTQPFCRHPQQTIHVKSVFRRENSFLGGFLKRSFASSPDPFKIATDRKTLDERVAPAHPPRTRGSLPQVMSPKMVAPKKTLSSKLDTMSRQTCGQIQLAGSSLGQGKNSCSGRPAPNTLMYEPEEAVLLNIEGQGVKPCKPH